MTLVDVDVANDSCQAANAPIPGGFVGFSTVGRSINNARINRTLNLSSCFLCLFFLTSLILGVHQICVANPPDPLDPNSTRDLLRGYSDEELAVAKQLVPQRPEPPLGETVSRTVHVSGRVFLDANANGRLDTNEKGIAGVLVTDGTSLMRTGNDGKYDFTFDMTDQAHCRFVVMTRPCGYEPTNSFFLRVPFADAQTDYHANFGLANDPPSSSRAFWFIAASDSQFGSHDRMIPNRKDYEQITSAPGNPAFLVTIGDLTSSGTHFQWDMYDRIRAASHIRVYDSFGGHDGNCLKPKSTANYELRVGPPFYSWEYGGVHFVSFVIERHYLGSELKAMQKAWLEADLQAIPKSMPVIVAAHYPLPAKWFDEHLDKGINLVCQIGAHWHNVQLGSRRGVPVLIAAPARGDDCGAYSRVYRWFHVTPEGVCTQLRVAGQYERLEVVSPGPSSSLGRCPLVVLAYDTANPVRSVSCEAIDPDGQRHPVELSKQGDWSWHGELTATLPGKWEFALEATTESGLKWKRRQSVEIEQCKPAKPELGDDFPWILAGEPLRRIAEGPGAKLVPLWVTHTGSRHVVHASPAIADGRVYVAVTDLNAGGTTSGVLCLDALTGEQIWKADSPLGDIRSGVTVHDGRVYAISSEGWLAAYDAATGERLWAKPFNKDYTLGRPLAQNQTLPVPTQYGLLASDFMKPQFLFDYRTGEQLARLDGAHIGYYAAFPIVSDDIMYCASRSGATAQRMPDGEIMWQKEEKGRGTSAAIVIDGKMIYNTSNGTVARDAVTGELIWQTPVASKGYFMAVPVVWDDLILVNGTNFVALDLKTGEPRWTVACAQDATRFVRSQRQSMSGSSTPIIAGDLAYFGHDDTSIRAVNREGKVVWEHRLGTPIKTAPVISGNLLFVHDLAGNLWCFAPKSVDSE